MKFKISPQSWRLSFWRKHRFSMSDREDGREEWHVHISPAGVTAALTSALLIIFLLLLLLVAYTPVLEILPGFRTEAARQRELLIGSLIRLDSLERQIDNMAEYNENVLLVIEGKTPAMRTVNTDSLKFDKTLVAPSREDSLLRKRIKSLNALSSRARAEADSRASSSAVAPMYGVVAERFNVKDGLYGVRIAGSPESQIVAIEDGTVIACEWLPDSGTMLQIQHENGVVSIYRNLSHALVQRAQKIKGGEVIGYSAKDTGDGRSTLFEFELWKGAKPIDPEGYIVF